MTCDVDMPIYSQYGELGCEYIVLGSLSEANDVAPGVGSMKLKMTKNLRVEIPANGKRTWIGFWVLSFVFIWNKLLIIK